MKKIAMVTVFLILSCASQKNMEPASVSLTGECPKNAKCTIELKPNKSMAVKSDEWGKTYYSLEEDPAKSVIVYTYSRIVKGDIQDGGYREEIVFEINKNGNIPSLSDASLQSTKMLFGRFCFCKGQTGYYKIMKGNLSVTASPGSKTGTLAFTIDEVPQIITGITFRIK